MPAPTPLPDWIAETPEDWYELGCYRESFSEQVVQVTRKEFISLKEHLAELRGYPVEAKEKVAFTTQTP